LTLSVYVSEMALRPSNAKRLYINYMDEKKRVRRNKIGEE